VYQKKMLMARISTDGFSASKIFNEIFNEEVAKTYAEML